MKEEPIFTPRSDTRIEIELAILKERLDVKTDAIQRRLGTVEQTATAAHKRLDVLNGMKRTMYAIALAVAGAVGWTILNWSQLLDFIRFF